MVAGASSILSQRMKRLHDDDDNDVGLQKTASILPCPFPAL